MERRFSLLSKSNSRSIYDYNKDRDDEDSMLPIIIVVDEFADLLNPQKGPSCEEYIIRLAKKARAAGIHLILATQRPSADVLTPHLKANIVCRLSLKSRFKEQFKSYFRFTWCGITPWKRRLIVSVARKWINSSPWRVHV